MILGDDRQLVGVVFAVDQADVPVALERLFEAHRFREETGSAFSTIGLGAPH